MKKSQTRLHAIGRALVVRWLAPKESPGGAVLIRAMGQSMEQRNRKVPPPRGASSRLRYGIAAGLLGRGITTLVGIILVPFYLSNLGVEAVGLIGFYTSILGLVLVIDQVLGVFVMRETARLSQMPQSSDKQRDLLVTAEATYLLIGILIAVIMTAAAPHIAREWISSTALERGTVVACLMFAAWTIPLQLLLNLHVNTLTGLERQIEANILQVTGGVGRGVLAVLSIVAIRAVTESYFAAQLVATLVTVALSIMVTWRRMPSGSCRPTIHFSILTQTWRFSSLLVANAMVVAVMVQADKIIVSGLLPLRTFGYYVLAATITSLPALAVSPIMMVLLPRFSRLVESAESDVAELFHLASQLVSVALLPVWSVTLFFPGAIVTVWTGDVTSAMELSLILPLLMSGAILLSLNCVPNALALAAGWPQLPLYANLFALLAVPLGYLLTAKFGAEGATAIWIVFGAMNVTLTPFLIHRRTLRDQLARWYFVDVGMPLVAAIAVGFSAYLLLPLPDTRIGLFVVIAGVWTLASFVAALAAPGLRAESVKLARIYLISRS